MKRYLIVDLDGTLCDCSHRVHWAQAKEWEQFDAGIPEDKVNSTIRWICQMAQENGVGVIICTGRGEKNRNATLSWLKANDCSSFSDVILMRPEGDRTPDHQLKLQLVYDHFGSESAAKEQVLCALDDRDRVVEAWRNAGFQCWQVQAGSY